MFKIELHHPVDALVCGYALDEGIKRYEESIEYWNSPERTVSPDGRRTILDTLTDDVNRLHSYKSQLDRQLENYRRSHV